MEIIKMFGTVSGLNLNITKSQAIWLGLKAGSNEKICKDLDITWTNENFKLLGIKFTNDLKNMTELNYNEKILSLRKLLGSSAKRDLTPIGKITIIKSLAIPKLVHLFSSLPNPGKTIVNDLEIFFFKFIWNGKPDKIKRLTLIGLYNKGGLNMTHIQSFINYMKIKWIKRIHDQPDGSWQKFLSTIFNINLEAEGLCRLNRKKLIELKQSVTNNFWKDVIESVILLKKDNLSMSEYLQQDIRNFCPISEFDYYTKWRANNVYCLNDLLKYDGHFKSFEEFKNQSGCNNFLKYYQIINKVPKEWKTKIRLFKEQEGTLDVCEEERFFTKKFLK